MILKLSKNFISPNKRSKSSTNPLNFQKIYLNGYKVNNNAYIKQ